MHDAYASQNICLDIRMSKRLGQSVLDGAPGRNMDAAARNH